MDRRRIDTGFTNGKLGWRVVKHHRNRFPPLFNDPKDETKVFQLPAHKGYRQADGRTSLKNRKNQKFRQTQRKPKKAPSLPARIAAHCFQRDSVTAKQYRLNVAATGDDPRTDQKAHSRGVLYLYASPLCMQSPTEFGQSNAYLSGIIGFHPGSVSVHRWYRASFTLPAPCR